MASVSTLAAPLPSFAQVSEKAVQDLEQQEFGIDTGTQAKPKSETDEPPAAPLDDFQPEAEAEQIKPIEAEEFKVSVRRKSTSGRVLLLDDASEHRPKPGKILLIKSGSEDVTAVRVLKNYPGKFAAKIVLPFTEPQVQAEYRALKKIGDKIIHMIKEREKRGKDLDALKTDEDLAREVAPDDNELDRGIPSPKAGGQKVATSPEPKRPPPLFNKDGEELDMSSIEVSEDDEMINDLSFQEDHPIEPYRHALSAQYGNMKSFDKDGNSASYNGFGLRYALNVFRMPFFKKKSLQDMFTFELGVFYYTITGFVTTDDEITVIPLIFTARYNLLIGENLTLFFYAGGVKNNVSIGEGTVSSNTSQLSAGKGAVGVGTMLKIGPGWAVRLDVGTDLFGVGAVLKF